MAFYTDIAKPARDRALKQLQPQTEEPYVSDPMFAVDKPEPTPNFQASMPGRSTLPLATQGFGVNPEDPFATTTGSEFVPGFSGTDQSEYKKAYQQEPATFQSMPSMGTSPYIQDRFNEPTVQDVIDSQVVEEPSPLYDPRGRQKGFESAAQEAAVGGLKGQTVELTTKMTQNESLIDSLAARGVKVDEVANFSSEGSGRKALMALGITADVGGALFEAIAETGWESVKFALGTGDIPTIFKEGFVATVEQHRQRSIASQIVLGVVFDPFVIAKVFSIPAKASGTVLRSALKSQLVDLADNNAVVLSRTQIDEAVENIAIQYENPQRFQNPLGNFDDVDLSFDDLPPVGAAREAPGTAYRKGSDTDDPFMDWIPDDGGDTPFGRPGDNPLEFDEFGEAIEEVFDTPQENAWGSKLAADNQARQGGWDSPVEVSGWDDLEKGVANFDEVGEEIATKGDAEDVHQYALDNQTDDMPLVDSDGQPHTKVYEGLGLEKYAEGQGLAGGGRTPLNLDQLKQYIRKEGKEAPDARWEAISEEAMDVSAAAPSPAAAPWEEPFDVARALGETREAVSSRIAAREEQLGRRLNVDEIEEIRVAMQSELKPPPTAAVPSPAPAAVPTPVAAADDSQRQVIANKWATSKARNSANAATDLNKLKESGFDVGDAEDALTEYKNTVRADFDDADDFSEARTEAWDNFVTALDDVESADTGLPAAAAPSPAAAPTSGSGFVGKSVEDISGAGLFKGSGTVIKDGPVVAGELKVLIDIPGREPFWTNASALREMSEAAATPPPAVAAPTPVAAADEVVAPRFVETSKPRYIKSKVDFDSPLDKALYIVANSAKRSTKDPEILKFAMDATGLSEAGARSAGDNIRTAIRGLYDGSDTLRVPRQYDAPRVGASAPEPAAVVPIPSPAQVAGPSSPSRLDISQVLSKNDVVITESRGGWNARVERRKTNDVASYSLVSGAESEEVAKRQAYDALQARHAGDGGGPRRPIEEALDDAVDPDDAGELYPEIGRMLEKGEFIRDMDRPAMVGKLIDSLPGIGDAVDWIRPANTLSEDIILAHLTKTSTRAMLNSKSTFWRQFQLYPVLQKTFGPNALNGKPIDQIVFIGSLDQVVPFNKTLFDIAQRPSLYQLDEAQKNALAIWSRHQDQLTEEVVEGYGVKLRSFEIPEGAVFLSSVDVNDDLLKQLDSTEYKQVQKGRGQARVHDSAADRWLSDLNKAVNDKSAQLKRDLTPKEIDELKGDVKFKPLVDIEKLQAGMDVWKNNNAARQVFKEGSGGKTRAEALELILNPITGKPKYQGLIDARKATIRQIANLRNRIEKYRVPTGAIDPETGKPIYTQQPSAKGGLKDKQNLGKAETKARQIARRINEIQTQIDDAGDTARAGGDVSSANGDIYGPQFSYLHGQLHELNVSLTKSFNDAVTYKEFVGDKATEGVAMMDELEGLLHQLYGNPAGKNKAEKIGIKGRYDAIGPESDGWILVKEGGLYRYYKGDDARNIQKLVKMDENGVLAAIEEIRSTAFAADLSPLFGVQLPLAVIANPKGVAASLIGAGKDSVKYRDMMRIFRTQNMVKVISEDFDGYMDYAFYTGREVIADTPKEFKGGLLARLPLGMGQKFTQANEAMYSVVLRQSKNLYDEGIKDLLKAGASPEQAKAISADAANKVIPMWNPSRLGMSVQKEQLFRTLPTSISFLTKPVELMATATSGYLKLPLVATGKATLSFQERLAIKWTTRMAAAWMTAATTSQVAATFYSDTDKDPWQAAKDATIPGSGSWGAIQIGPYKIPAGGPFRGFIQALVPRDVAGVPFPVPFAGLWNWANNRITPVISNAIDQYKNEDFYGAKIVPKDAAVGEEIFRRFAYFVEGASPLTVGSVVGNVRRGLGNVEDFGNLIDWQKVAEDFVSQLGGSNMSKESPYTTSDLAARKWAKDNGIKQYNDDDVKRTRDLPEGELQKFREERSDLKDRIDEEVKKSASLEIEWAVPTYKAMRLKADKAEEQEIFDGKLEDFWLDAAIPGAMNPSEWRESRRNRMLALASERKGIYGDFPEKDEKDKTPTDWYYEEFDRIREKHHGDMTREAWDEIESWISKQNTKDRAWIETNTGLSNLTPKVEEYHEDMSKLDEYWDIEENFFNEFPLDAETKFLWDQYKNATKAQKQSGMYSMLRDIEEAISDERKFYRFNNKEVDGILAKWDYSGIPQHPENRDRWLKLPVLLDFHLRESEYAPKTTPASIQSKPRSSGSMDMMIEDTPINMDGTYVDMMIEDTPINMDEVTLVGAR